MIFIPGGINNKGSGPSPVLNPASLLSALRDDKEENNTEKTVFDNKIISEVNENKDVKKPLLTGNMINIYDSIRRDKEENDREFFFFLIIELYVR